MHALLLEERKLTELDRAQPSRLIRSHVDGAFAPPASLDGLLGLLRRVGHSLYQWANRLPRHVRERTNGNEWRTCDNADLHGLLSRLQRNDLDLRERLAIRVEELGGPDASISDPLYQRHYFLVQSLEAERKEVESDLSRRDESLQTEEIGFSWIR